MSFLQMFCFKKIKEEELERSWRLKKKGRGKSHPKMLRDVLLSEGCIQRGFMEVPHINPAGN